MPTHPALLRPPLGQNISLVAPVARLRHTADAALVALPHPQIGMTCDSTVVVILVFTRTGRIHVVCKPSEVDDMAEFWEGMLVSGDLAADS
jgi:hypothetical protein